MENTMRSVSLSTAFALALLLAAAPTLAQGKPEVFNIPLSRPGEPLSLEVSMKSAHITVIGENRTDAEFEFSIKEGERVIVTPSGPQSISSAGYALEIDERDNQISIDTDWRNNKVVLVARIPMAADLEINTHDDGVIIVNNVSGDLELSNINGPITATGISGSVIAESVNDTIDLTFASMDNAKASSLETVNGELRIRLPANTGAQIHLDTSQGEIFSDFEVDVQPSTATVERDEEHGGVEIRIESVIIANINGGGPVIRMNSLNGDLHILKSN
jgi:DUF4097 and DUF4098 domain-containing protein YvlB